MFYSHQLLARKAPLGQIWMAATMHAKMNRRKLDKLNIIKICEEILNPSVPMALRLSGILMGGVVIVYERKVKLLYEDVTRLLVEINEAWKFKSTSDPTVLPKGKSQAKYDAVTLPDNEDADLGEIERSVRYTNTTTMMGFQQTAYVAMRLDSVDEPYINNNTLGEEASHHYHQADVENITLFEHYDSYHVGTDYNHFERFDIQGDEETQVNWPSQEHTQIPDLIPSPPPCEERKEPDEIQENHFEDRVDRQVNETKEASQILNWQPQQDQNRQVETRRRARKPASFSMDYKQTIIPGHIYQSWLQNSSDISSRRGRKRKLLDVMSTIKIPKLMEIPPFVLACGLFENGNQEIHYPAPLMELWIRSTQPPQDSPSGRISAPQPPQPSSASAPERRENLQDPIGYPYEYFNGGFGSPSLGVPTEKQRSPLNNNNSMMPQQILREVLKTSTLNNGFSVRENNSLVTPGASDDVRSIPSSGSGQGFLSHGSDVNSGRSNKKRPHSSSKLSGSSLEPVPEEGAREHLDFNFKLSRLSENGPTLDNDLLMETGPTQTQQPPIINPPDQITDSIRKQLKAHFDTPGASRFESLDELASGMNKKRAANLFYQTCVLATRDFIRVEQKEAYGDILISRGAKM